MAEAILDIKHWDNNLGVRLPAAVAREAHLHADQQVRVTVEEGRVVIEPIRDEPKVRCRGLVKCTGQIVTLFALTNLWLARKRLLPLLGEMRP